MVKTEELRIGNLVCVTTKGGGDIIDSVSQITLFNNSPRITTSFHWHKAEPIPLTEEILLDCGLKEQKEDKPHFVNIFGNPHWIQYLKSIEGVVIHIGGGEHFTIPNIKYVHQLQNLYFALTGKELEFKTLGK